MNHYIIQGHLGRNPEIETIEKTGTEVCKFPVAVNQGKDKDPLWVKCSVFGFMKDKIMEYFKSGKPITVYGEPRINAWLNKEGDPKAEIQLYVKGWNFVNIGNKQNGQEVNPPESVADEEVPF